MKQARTMFGGYAIGMIVIAFLVFGCNSAGDKKDTGDTTVTVEQKQEVGADTVISYQTYLLTKENLQLLFKTTHPTDEVDMIYFQYGKVGTTEQRDYSVLQAYGASSEGNDLNAPITLPVVATGPVLSFEEAPYDQQITIGNVRGFLGLGAGTGRIPKVEFNTDVWLVPCVMTGPGGEELIYYRMTPPAHGGAACPAAREPNQEGRISTNPSPPAKPCADPPGDCGGIEFLKKFTKDSLIMNAAKSPKTH